MDDTEVFTQPEWGKKLSRYICIPQRVILAVMGFVAVVICHMQRHASLFIVDITTKETKNKTDLGVCPMPENQSDAVQYQVINEWSEEDQRPLRYIFFASCLPTSLAGGLLADLYGAKWVLWLGMLISTIMTFCTPVAITALEQIGLFIVRFLMGLAQGVVVPALASWLAAWVPANERGRLGALVMSGEILGRVSGNFISGQFFQSRGWPVLYYVFGAVSLVWLILLLFLCFSYPAGHPYIKETELEFLRSEIGYIGKVKKSITIYWRIGWYWAVVALVYTQFGFGLSLYVITKLSTYMTDVLNISPKDIGMYGSIVFVAMWISCIEYGFTTDFLIDKKVISLNLIRKQWTLIAAVGPGVFMVIASYCGCNVWIVGIMLSISIILICPYYSGINLTPLDMSPKYAGTLMGFTNFFTLSAYLLASRFIPTSLSLMEWRIMFWVIFAILTIFAIFFWICGTNERHAVDDL